MSFSARVPKPATGSPIPAMQDANQAVTEWLTTTVERWERALDTDPPDMADLHDMPPLPGHISLGAFLDALKMRIGS